MSITTQTIPSKLRHLQTFTTSGNFYPPAGTTVVYVTVLGATGGVGAGHRYAPSGKNGGLNVSAAGFVQVNPQAPHGIVIGAAGANGSSEGAGGGASGTTIFDGAITVNGANAGGAPWGGNTGNAGNAVFVTNLPTLNPSANTIARVTTTQTGNVSSYTQSGIIHIFGY